MILQTTRPVQGGIRQERRLELIANHLANVNTSGYKADILAFDDMFRARLAVDHRQGDMQVTGNKLDIAIAGQGFFRIQTPEGIRYTRDGSFTLDRNRALVTQNGDAVVGDAGDIILQGGEAEISDNIVVHQNGDIMIDNILVDRMSIVTFDDLSQLEKVGSSMFAYTGPPGDERIAAEATVKQGTLEKSNITIALEMTKMIHTHRMYEAYQKMIQTFDEIDSKIILDVGKN